MLARAAVPANVHMLSFTPFNVNSRERPRARTKNNARVEQQNAFVQHELEHDMRGTCALAPSSACKRAARVNRRRRASSSTQQRSSLRYAGETDIAGQSRAEACDAERNRRSFVFAVKNASEIDRCGSGAAHNERPLRPSKKEAAIRRERALTARRMLEISLSTSSIKEMTKSTSLALIMVSACECVMRNEMS